MMAKAKRIIAFALVLCLLLCLLPSCADKSNRAAFVLPETFETIATGTLAENTDYTLKWDDAKKSVMMYSKADGRAWGTSPMDAYESDSLNSFIGSPITIEVVSVSTLGINVARAWSSSISEGTVSAKKIKNGVEVTYYFNEYSVSVPVQYTLRADSMSVSVDSTKITEGEKYQLKSVTLAPYMCALENIKPKEEEDDSATEGEETPAPTEKVDVLDENYLFAPIGNGVLISPELKDDDRSYTGEVYGTDGSRYQPYEYYKPESIKMPVFGAKDGDHAILGIIEQGAEQVELAISAGNTRPKYSNIAAQFNVRGYDIYADDYSESAMITTRVSKAMADSTFSIGFYPLRGEDADYIGMANRYREYLIGKGLKKNTTPQNVYALSILGNVVTTSLAFGVPYQSAKNMTSFSQAATMVKELANETKQNPAVQLAGFGESGVDIGPVAGGFDFASVSGSKDDYKALTDYATKNKISLFTDFDLVFFNEGGNGYSTTSNAAKTATLHKSELYYRMLALRAQDKDLGAYHVLNRAGLFEAMEDLLDEGEDLGVTGYSFGTLGQVAYSDYQEARYQIKMGMGADVQKLFGSVSAAGHKVATDNANDYAVMSADTVFNVEVDPRYSNAFDRYVPFYQIVFKGYVPLYSDALNLATDYDTSVLNALATGVGFGYTLIDHYDTAFAESPSTKLYSSVYSAKKAMIVETVTKYDDYFKAIDGATITDYEVLDGGLTKTTFSNGVIAYTNPTDMALSTGSDAPATVPAGGFAYVRGGTNA